MTVSPTIIVPKQLGLFKVEELLSKVAAYSGTESFLRIPNSVFLWRILGHEIALIQLAITWARKFPSNGELHTYIDELGDASHKKFLETLLGITVASISPKISLIGHREVGRYDVLQQAKPIIDAMDEGEYENTGKGPDVKLLSISGARKRYIQSVFEAPRKIKPHNKLVSEIRSILDVILPASGDGKNIWQIIEEEELLPDIAWIVYELFQNIYEHAETNIHGESYPRTVGGAKFSVRKINKEKAGELLPIDDPEYLSMIYSRNSNVRFLEVSFFDSGPGYARRWSDKDLDALSFNDEKNYVMACLAKNKSTKSGRSFGMGLPNVLSVLSRRQGILKIRSGHLCVAKAFGRDNKEIQYERLLESLSLSEERAPVEGVAFTVCLPFVKKAPD